MKRAANSWSELSVLPRHQVGAEIDGRAEFAKLIAELAGDQEKISEAARTRLRGIARKLLESPGLSVEEAADGSPPPGKRSWSTVVAYQSRDPWLVAAWDALAADLADKPRAQRLAKEILDFEDSCWLTWRDKARPPHGTTRLREALFYAFKATNGGVPRSWERLRDVVKRAKAAGASAGASGGT